MNEDKMDVMEAFLHKLVESGHRYYCPKAEGYFGDWDGFPIEDRPCTCEHDEAKRTLGLPDYKDPQLQAEYEKAEMPEGEW